MKPAESDHGAFNTPSRPTIAFLIKHPRPALNLWLSANDLEMKNGVAQPKPPPQQQQVKKLSVPEPQPTAPPPPPEPKMTWAQIVAYPDDDDD